ncbi:MAG: BsuPI-related putative proteinase inhibitor [bacterium]
MKQLFFFPIIFITFFFVACDFPAILSGDNQSSNSDQEARTENLLFVEITGGIAGINQRLIVDESGQALFVDSFHPGAKWVVQLSSSELNNLISLILENHFFQLNSDYVDGQVADAFFYAISFNYDDKTKTVTTDYFAAPANLKRIVDGVLALKTRITDNGLDLKLELSQSEIVMGDKVELKLVVTNSLAKPLSLHFSSGQIFDFFAFIEISNHTATGSDSLIWNWAHDKLFTENVWDLILAAGESRSYQVTWDGRDLGGKFVSGEITIGAELVSVPGGCAEQQKLLIRKVVR